VSGGAISTTLDVGDQNLLGGAPTRRVAVRRRTLDAGVIVACLAGCLTALMVPVAHGYDLASNVMVGTIGAVAACAAAGVLLIRLADAGARSDFALAVAAATLATTSLLLCVIPTALAARSTPALAGARAAGWLAGAALFAWAGWVEGRPLQQRAKAAVAVAMTIAIAAATALAGALVGIAWPHLFPVGHAGGVSALGSRAPALMFAQIGASLLFGAAALGFSRRRREHDSGLTLFVVAACVLAAWSRVEFVTAGELGSSWAVQGAALRTLSLLALAAGAALELRAIPYRAARRAVASERARLARELHDGMAQELAYIVSQSTRLARQAPPESDIAGIAIAAQRALDDSRASIEMLNCVPAGSLSEALAGRLQEIARRARIRLALEIPDDLRIPAEQQHDVVRIVTEAVNNVANHAGATTVTVGIERRDGRTIVRIVDDGRGFNTSAAEPEPGRGRGLTNMTYRAGATGAELRLESTVGRGTTVELALP
jgi:signal transduction histidine kinase